MVRRARSLALLSLAVCGLALAAAFGAEWYGGLVPCALCLVERWPYRIAIVLSVAGLIVPSRWWIWGVAGCMAVSVAVAVVHVGVEQGRWPSPLPECAAPNFGGGSIAERLQRMPSKPAKPCDEPTFLVPSIPVSMAGMNLLLALALGSFLAISLSRPTRNQP